MRQLTLSLDQLSLQHETACSTGSLPYMHETALFTTALYKSGSTERLIRQDIEITKIFSDSTYVTKSYGAVIYL